MLLGFACISTKLIRHRPLHLNASNLRNKQKKNEKQKKIYRFNQSNQFLETEPNPIQNNGNGVLSNKLSRLTLATFDDEGRCIGQMGSLSISY
jgi:hypothetical protein